MSYGRNFGFRSFENIVRDGRLRVPSTGTALKIGEPVMLDTANPGKVAAATEALTPSQNAGIVVFEHRSFNQKGEEVAYCKRSALMKKKPA